MRSRHRVKRRPFRRLGGANDVNVTKKKVAKVVDKVSKKAKVVQEPPPVMKPVVDQDVNDVDSDDQPVDEARMMEAELTKTLGVMSCADIRAYLKKTKLSNKEKAAFIQQNMKASSTLRNYIKSQKFSAKEMGMLKHGGAYIVHSIGSETKKMTGWLFSGSDDLTKDADCVYLQNIVDEEQKKAMPPGKSSSSKTQNKSKGSKSKSKTKSKRGWAAWGWSKGKNALNKARNVATDAAKVAWASSKKLAGMAGNLAYGAYQSVKYLVSKGFQLWSWVSSNPCTALVALTFLNSMKNKLCRALGTKMGVMGVDSVTRRENWLGYLKSWFPNEFGDYKHLPDNIKTQDQLMMYAGNAVITFAPLVFLEKVKLFTTNLITDISVWFLGALQSAASFIPYVGGAIAESIGFILTSVMTYVKDKLIDTFEYIGISIRNSTPKMLMKPKAVPAPAAVGGPQQQQQVGGLPGIDQAAQMAADTAALYMCVQEMLSIVNPFECIDSTINGLTHIFDVNDKMHQEALKLYAHETPIYKRLESAYTDENNKLLLLQSQSDPDVAELQRQVDKVTKAQDLLRWTLVNFVNYLRNKRQWGKYNPLQYVYPADPIYQDVINTRQAEAMEAELKVINAEKRAKEPGYVDSLFSWFKSSDQKDGYPDIPAAPAPGAAAAAASRAA